MKNKLYLLAALFLSTWGPGCVETALAGNGSGNVSRVMGLGAAGPAVGSVAAPSSSVEIPSGKTVFTITAGDIQAAQSNGNYYPFYKNGVAFQAGASGTYCFNFRLAGNTVSTGVQLISATASFAFNANSITGGVYQQGASGKTGFMVGSTVYAWFFQSGVYTFGANTYGGYQANNSQGFSLAADCYDL